MNATLKDIATRAHCSPATVSRAINGTAGVNSALLERIHAAMAELEARSASAAGGRHRGRPRGSVALSDTVDVVLFRNEGFEPVVYSDRGLVIASVEEEYPEKFNSPRLRLATDFYRNIIAGVTEELAKTGMQTNQRVCKDLLDEKLIARLNKSRHRGVLLMGSPDRSELEFIHRCTMPIVLIDILGVPGVPVVAVDNLGGISQSLQHLIALGHQRIGFAGNDQNPSLHIRYLAFCGGMTGAGLAVEPGWCLLEPGPIKQVFEQYVKILASPSRPTAVVCANDCFALGVLKAAEAAGLRVPEDLSVVGFDDMEVARMLSPPLTTVRVPTLEMGACAASILLRITEDPSQADTWRHAEVRCRTELVPRGTSCPPAKAKGAKMVRHHPIHGRTPHAFAARHRDEARPVEPRAESRREDPPRQHPDNAPVVERL